MPILLNHQLQEQISYETTEFPVAYYHDELEQLPNWTGPIHWHPDFEIATAARNVLDYQVGQHHIILKAGDSIFINGNMLHRVCQLSGNSPDPVPIIIFSGASVFPEYSAMYQKYILPIAQCDSLPFVVFRQEDSPRCEVNYLLQETYRCLSQQVPCYEMKVQRKLSRFLEYLFLNLNNFPQWEASRIQLKNQIRLQKMLTYIYEHYGETVTLEDIANAAHISRSEAGRCFQTYLKCSPIEALIQYRLQTARRLLREKTHTLQEISVACGFNSVNYFSRQFKKVYGVTPGQNRDLGK